MCFQSQIPKKCTYGNVAYVGFVVCMVLFCAYMQWSPVVDLDYVSINGHEHDVGAANPHQMDNIVTPTTPHHVGAFLEDSAYQFLTLPLIQSTERADAATTLRL
jgi:hypothetical protein